MTSSNILVKRIQEIYPDFDFGLIRTTKTGWVWRDHVRESCQTMLEEYDHLYSHSKEMYGCECEYGREKELCVIGLIQKLCITDLDLAMVIYYRHTTGISAIERLIEKSKTLGLMGRIGIKDVFNDAMGGFNDNDGLLSDGPQGDAGPG